jgi:acetolactate synthase-1/2/3 large subunit
MSITGSHLFARALAQEGVRTVFTLAGDHILPVLDVMEDFDFRFIDGRHEQAVVHMADAWARINNQVGVCIVTTPGHANALPGLVHAMATEAPVLNISGSDKLSNYDRGMMQEIDQIGMAKATCKAAWLVRDADRLPEYISMAIRTALSGRRGPVHLTIPIDVQEAVVDQGSIKLPDPGTSRRSGHSVASRNQIGQAIQLLHASERPMVVASNPAGYEDSSTDSLRRLLEATRIPLFTEGTARGIVPDDHPYCFGFFDLGLNRAAAKICESDAVLVLGKKLDYSIGYALPPVVAADAAVIQVDPDPEQIGRNRSATVGIVGDVTGVVGQLADEAAALTWPDRPWVASLNEQLAGQAQWSEAAADPGPPMHPLFVFHCLERLLRDDDIVVFDGGDFCHFGKLQLPARPRSWWSLPDLGMLGSAMPTAIAAKASRPDARVVLITGDGSFGFNGMEFDTAVRHRLDIVTVLGNDSAWGIDRQIQLAAYGRAVATDLLPSRYDLVAEGLGGHGEFVQRPDELIPALERAFAAGKPALVNVATQRVSSPRGERAIARRKAGD